MMTSCAPSPFILSNIPSAWRFDVPSIPSAGNLLGTTRTDQPGLFFCALPFDSGRYARTSEGVLLSLPGHSGQKPPFCVTLLRRKSLGRLARSVEIMTQRPTTGSFLNSGTEHPLAPLWEKPNSATLNALVSPAALCTHTTPGERVFEKLNLGRCRGRQIHADHIEA